MIRYLWGKSGLRKVDEKDLDVLKTDIEKKPEIPFLSIFGRVHAKFLKSRRYKHHERN